MRARAAALPGRLGGQSGPERIAVDSIISQYWRDFHPLECQLAPLHKNCTCGSSARSRAPCGHARLRLW